MSIGDRIKEMREKRGMSVDDLVKETKIPRNTLYRYERGETRSIPADNLNKIAEALRVPRECLDGTAPEVTAPGFDAKEWTLTRIQMFLKNYEAFLYMLSISEVVDDDANLCMYNLRGDSITMDAAKRIDLFLSLTKEAQSYVARGGKEGINDAYDHLDEHGRAVVDAVLKLEQERMAKQVLREDSV